jgi:hypothetical protein
MTEPEENLLEGRVCADRIASYPNLCILQLCSRYESCYAEILRAQHSIDHFRRNKGGKKP